jgi:segregation and condensation protein B
VSDERPNSLAAQAASWVPPWERAQRPPDPAYAESAPEPDISDDIDPTDADSSAGPEAGGNAGPEADADAAVHARLGDGAAVDPHLGVEAAGGSDLRAEGAEPVDDLSDPGPQARADTEPTADQTAEDEPAADESGLGPEDVPAELPPLPGEAEGAATVDAPQELPGEEPLEPTELGVGPEVALPPSIEQAAEDADDDLPGHPVDAPLPPDGDDAGDVFDQAADDEVDDADIDLAFTEEVPATDDPPADAEQADAEPSEDGLGEDEPADEPADEEPADDEPAPDELAADEPASEEPAPAGRTGAAIPAQGRGSAAPAIDADRRTEEEPAPMDEAEMRAALESILLVVDEPVAEMQLAQILEQPTERVAAVLEDISARYTAAGHGFDLRRAAGGWRLYTRPEYAAYVERFVLDGQSVRLTQAALETLAVVAYKQPVTRSRISAIRGVNCDGVMRTLVTRGLVEECGTESETGAHLYRTTVLFLEKLGLNSVDQLPPLAPFLPDDVEEVLDASG